MPVKHEAPTQPWWDADFLAQIANKSSWECAAQGTCRNRAHREGQPTYSEPQVCRSCSFLIAPGVK